MGEWVDVTLNVEAKNLERVLSVFKDNSIEVVGFEKPDKVYNDGSDTVTIEMAHEITVNLMKKQIYY